MTSSALIQLEQGKNTLFLVLFLAKQIFTFISKMSLISLSIEQEI